LKPIISINVLTYNSEKYIEDCIFHLLNQSYENLEINIIDNKSSDATLDIVSRFDRRINLILNKKNYGYCGGNNIGIQKCSGEYILVLNPDVYLDKDYVRNIINGIHSITEKEPFGGAIGMLYRKTANSDDCYIDTMGLAIRKDRRVIAKNYGKKLSREYTEIEEVFGIDGMAAFYSRKFLDDVKVKEDYFDQDFFAYCEDQDLAWRGRALGWKFYFIPGAKARHVRTFKPGKLFARQKLDRRLKAMALRNHYLMVIKNDSFVNTITDFPFIVIRFIKIFSFSLLFEPYNFIALVDIIKSLPKTLKKRKSIQARIKNKKDFIREWIGKVD
jgi:GT2 family glycosyltransferase